MNNNPVLHILIILFYDDKQMYLENDDKHREIGGQPLRFG